MTNTAKIQRGSLFLTDDFVQALSYNVPAQISSFALLNLPEFGGVEMNITAAELGMSAGTTDPNEIMPALFAQYWQNLCAYARQYHANLDYGEDIEDFAEQAFWKMLKRTMPTRSYDSMTSYIVAKSNDVLTNTNSADGNMFMELLISANATIRKQNVTFVQSKPTYLQSIARLPSADTSNTQILGGHALAVYDYDKNYYDLQASECVVAQYEDIEDVETAAIDFTYNAILLYYEVGNVEQVAGIYFPNAYVEMPSGAYALPAIAKQSDTNFGYSINIRYRAGEVLDYNASNADSGNAMQIYNTWYRAMSQANLQLAQMANTIAQQGLDIDNLKATINGGYLAALRNDMNALQQQIQTTYKGSVSTNRLLELFTQAKNNAGLLNLTIQLSDLSQALTSRDITVSSAQGSYQVGDVIPMGTSITDVIARMLYSETVTEYQWPEGVLTINGSTGTIYVEFAEDIMLECQVVLQQNDGGAFAYPADLILSGETTQQEQITGPTQMIGFNIAEITGLYTCSLAIQYAEGPVKPGDTSNNNVNAGILRLSCRVIPVYTAYVGSVQMLEQLESLTSSSIKGWQAYQSNELPVLITSANDYQCLAIPAAADNPIVNIIAGTRNLEIDGVDYTVYAAHTRYLSIDSSNLQ